VQQFLSGKVSNFVGQKWKGRIVLPLIPVTDALIHQHGGIDKVLSSLEPTPIDICDYLGNNTSTLCLYFDPKVYPPPEKGSKYVPSQSLKKKKKGDLNFKYDCKDDEVFITLKEYIERESVQSDCSVIMNGNNGRSTNTRKYVCSDTYRNRNEGAKKEDKDSGDNDCIGNEVANLHDLPYRLTYMIKNDKKGRRDNGRAAPRRTATADSEHVCPFKFLKKWDEYGYFIELRRCAGCPMHQYHPQPIPNSTPMPGRLLTDAECETAKHIAKSTLNNGACRNYFQSTLKKHVSRAKIAYITSNGDGDKDEMERMFDFMDKSNDISYNMCWDPYKCDDDPRKKKLPLPQVGASSLVSTSKNEGGEVTHEEVNDDPTMHHIASEVEKARADQDIKKEEDVFVSIAWTNNNARRIFKLNPEVVTCDITSHSNKNKYLLTHSLSKHHMISKLYSCGYGFLTNVDIHLGGYFNMPYSVYLTGYIYQELR